PALCRAGAVEFGDALPRQRTDARGRGGRHARGGAARLAERRAVRAGGRRPHLAPAAVALRRVRRARRVRAGRLLSQPLRAEHFRGCGVVGGPAEFGIARDFVAPVELTAKECGGWGRLAEPAWVAE